MLDRELVYTNHVHYIQKQILDHLRTTEHARYSELQPDGIESSHFKYHLNLLIADGYITHPERGVYALTPHGKSYVDTLSAGRTNPHETPKVITYTLLYDKDNYYLWRKPKEPYRGLLTLLGGKLHTGEDAVTASSRELREKLNINHVAQPKLCGVANIRITNTDSLYTHAVAYICSAAVSGNNQSKQIVAIPRAELLHHNLAPDIAAVISAVESDQPFVIDIDRDFSET
jgi:ADP-ribose pyrophosphatase YjhB (NUDIX family)